MPGNPEEDQFLEEVIGLFAQEGREWLGQIDQACKELEASPAPDRASKLWDTVRRGLTSLGGSAATVELTAIEQVSLALLSLLESLQTRSMADSSAPWTVFRGGLDRLRAVLDQVAERKAGDFSDLETLCQQISAAVPAPAGATETPPPAGSGRLIPGLLALQQDAQRQPQAGRHLLDKVLHAVQQGHESPVEEQEARNLVLRMVEEYEGRDRLLLEQSEARIPRVIEEIGQLKALEQGAAVPEERTGQVLEDIRSLKEAAAAVDATAMTMFCAGLETFIGVIARRRLPIAPQRFDAVTARLGDMRRWVFDWAEMARTERTSIQSLLSR